MWKSLGKSGWSLLNSGRALLLAMKEEVALSVLESPTGFQLSPPMLREGWVIDGLYIWGQCTLGELSCFY